MQPQIIVLGEKLPQEGSSSWHTLGNLPGETLFQAYQRGEFIWTNASGISRDVQLLFWLAAGHAVTDLWRLRLARSENETTRFFLSDASQGLMGHSIDFTAQSGPDVAWMNAPQVALDRLRQYGGFHEPRRGRNVGITVVTEEEGAGFKATVRYASQTYFGNERIGWKGSSVGGEDIDTYQILPVTKRWADQWMEDQRRRAAGAVAHAEQYLTTRSAHVMGVTTIERALSPYARRVAHLFELL